MADRASLTRADWLRAALEVLEKQGVDQVRVLALAKDLGVTRGSFYWHFENRADLLQELLEYWASEYTGVVIRSPAIRSGEPGARLLKVAEMVMDLDLARYDLAMFAWAERDPQVAKAVERVYRLRLEFIGEAFEELGFEGEELEMRTWLFVCYQSWERTVFGRQSKRKRRELMKRRLALLTSE